MTEILQYSKLCLPLAHVAPVSHINVLRNLRANGCNYSSLLHVADLKWLQVEDKMCHFIMLMKVNWGVARGFWVQCNVTDISWDMGDISCWKASWISVWLAALCPARPCQHEAAWLQTWQTMAAAPACCPFLGSALLHFGCSVCCSTAVKLLPDGHKAPDRAEMITLWRTGQISLIQVLAEGDVWGSIMWF